MATRTPATEPAPPPASMPADPDSPLLEVDNLRVHFETKLGTVRAVDGLSFRLGAGETLAMVGESGCGKSASMLAITGLLPPAGRVVDGSARLRGRELLGAPERELARLRGTEIGMIFQDPLSALNPVLTIENQLVEAIRVHRRITRDAARIRALELFDLVGLPRRLTRAGRYPHELSGGMRQRAMIAIAIANQPSIVIADEPTTALDVTIQAQILDLLEELQRSIGMALVLITHDLAVVAEQADQVLVVYAGRVAEYAPADRIFASPLHPYTNGLLASIPSVARAGTRRLSSIPGRPPDLTAERCGCAFEPRCACARPICRQLLPVLRPAQDDPTHQCSCHALAAGEDPGQGAGRGHGAGGGHTED